MIIIILFLIVNILTITPMWHYYHLKEERLKIIRNLEKDCSSEDILHLILTYSDLYRDVDTAKCWLNYRNKCFSYMKNDLNLTIPIECKTY